MRQYFMGKGRVLKIYKVCRLIIVHALLIYTPCSLAVEVITHTDASVSLTQVKDLRAIFSMRLRYWPDGSKIRVFVLPDNNALHKKFVKEKLHMFPHQLRRTWDRMTYTGTGQPPVTVNSNAEMLEKIQNTPNAIGYIEINEANK